MVKQADTIRNGRALATRGRRRQRKSARGRSGTSGSADPAHPRVAHMLRCGAYRAQEEARDAGDEAGYGHQDDDVEVEHVPCAPRPRDAPAEDAAVVVEAGDAALARGAVVRRLARVLDFVAALAAGVLGFRFGPPDQAADAVDAVALDDVRHPFERVAVVEPLCHGFWKREAGLRCALDDACAVRDRRLDCVGSHRARGSRRPSHLGHPTSGLGGTTSPLQPRSR